MANEPISLCGDSTFNYVSQQTVAKVVKHIIKKKLFGSHDFVSQDTIKLRDLCDLLEINPSFGQGLYESPIDCFEPSRGLTKFSQTSQQEIQEFLKT